MSDNPAENRTLITSWDTQEVTEDQAFTILYQLSLRFGNFARNPYGLVLVYRTPDMTDEQAKIIQDFVTEVMA